MATTGQVNTNTVYDSFFWVYWKQDGNQDVAGNKTRIYWSCGVTCGHSFYTNAIKMSSVYIDGVLVYGGGTYSNFSKGEHRIASGYLDIPHNADGTKTFNISSFSGWLYASYNYSASASSHTLTAIPRGASLTGATDFKDTENPTITYSNPAGNTVSALEACISLTGAKDNIAYRSISKTGTSYTFPLTDAERNLLLNNTPGTSRTVHFYVRSKIGGSEFHSSLKKTFTVTENSNTKPSVTVGATVNNTGLPSEFNGLYIQGKSKVDISVTGQGKYGASVSSPYAVLEGKTYSSGATTDVLQGSGTITVTGYAKDSRGFTGSATKDITVIPYSKPMIVPVGAETAILCYRSDGSGKKSGNGEYVYLKCTATYSKVESGGVTKNSYAYQFRKKEGSGSWSNDEDGWVHLCYNDDTEDGEYIGVLPGEFELQKSFTIQIRAIDAFGEYDRKTFDIPTRDVALHLGKGGKNVSVGSYCDYSEPYTFHSEWKAIFDDEVIIQGQTLSDYIKSVMNGG